MAPPNTGNNLLGLIKPDRSKNERWARALQFVEEIDARLQKRQEYAERCYFGEADKPRSRRTWIYSHFWIIKTEGYVKTPAIAEDAVLARPPTAVSSSCSRQKAPNSAPSSAPTSSPSTAVATPHDDFTYPPDRNDRRVSNFLGNHGTCRTQCRDYDTLVGAVLLSVKHHLGDMAYVTSNAEPDREGWQAAFELYSRTFPEREIPWLNNWPQ